MAAMTGCVIGARGPRSPTPADWPMVEGGGRSTGRISSVPSRRKSSNEGPGSAASRHTVKLPDGDASGDDARFEAFISKELAPWVKILDSPPSESGGRLA